MKAFIYVMGLFILLFIRDSNIKNHKYSNKNLMIDDLQHELLKCLDSNNNLEIRNSAYLDRLYDTFDLGVILCQERNLWYIRANQIAGQPIQQDAIVNCAVWLQSFQPQ